MSYKFDKHHWRWGLREWQQEQWERARARERLDRMLNRYDERKPTPEEVTEFLGVALEGYAEKTVVRRLVSVLSKSLAQ